MVFGRKDIRFSLILVRFCRRMLQEIAGKYLGMLCHTQSSIKEIVNELKFPNLSFFGKYFKAHKGMSPKYYRTAYLNTQLSSL